MTSTRDGRQPCKGSPARRPLGIGFHSEKRAGVRDPAFRSLPPKIQEKYSGPTWETLRNIYDEVTVGDVR
jgi:hypothetical protein